MGADGISFGKGKSVDFSGFNGISSEHLKTDDAKKKKLSDAIFKKYDQNEDGVLDKGDLQALIGDIKTAAKGGKSDQLGKNEAQNYLTKQLGLTEGEYSREDLLELLEEINADKDNIESAETDNQDNTTIKYKADQNGTTQTDTYNKKQLTTRVISNQSGKSTITYQNGAMTKKVIEKQGEAPVTIEYEGDAGKEVEKSHYTKQGVVITYLDVNNRPTMKVTDKGSGITETVKYNVPQDRRGGEVADEVYVNNQLTKRTYKDGENVLRTTDYTYTENTVREITTEGDKRTLTERDLNDENKLYGRVEIDEEGNPKDHVHKVDKENDTWYGIVQAKYGQTDHAVIMEIVHQLKDAHHVAYNSKTIPDEITLPASLKLKSGATVELHDIEAQIDERHNIPKHISLQNAENIPEKLTLSADQKTVDMAQFKDITPPDTITIPDEMKTHDVNAEYAKYPQDALKAGKTVKENDNMYVTYDDEGKPLFVYSQDPESEGGENSKVIEFTYDMHGGQNGINVYKDNNEFLYSKDGKLETIIRNDQKVLGNYAVYDAGCKLNYYKIDLLDSNDNVVGKYSSYDLNSPSDYEKYELDADGMQTAAYKYEGGKLVGIIKYERDEHGNETREIVYDAEGNVTGFTDITYRQNGEMDAKISYNPDGTVDDYQKYRHYADGTDAAHYNKNGDFYDSY